jgi:hypothetical protein
MGYIELSGKCLLKVQLNLDNFIYNGLKSTIVIFKDKTWSQMLVAHACNLSYSGGRDQEDCSLNPAQANRSPDLILKIPNTHIKKGWWSGSSGLPSANPEFKTQYHRKR